MWWLQRKFGHMEDTCLVSSMMAVSVELAQRFCTSLLRCVPYWETGDPWRLDIPTYYGKGKFVLKFDIAVADL